MSLNIPWCYLYLCNSHTLKKWTDAQNTHTQNNTIHERVRNARCNRFRIEFLFFLGCGTLCQPKCQYFPSKWFRNGTKHSYKLNSKLVLLGNSNDYKPNRLSTFEPTHAHKSKCFMHIFTQKHISVVKPCHFKADIPNQLNDISNILISFLWLKSKSIVKSHGLAWS